MNESLVPSNKQQGVVLIVALIMLFLMTLLGVTSMQSTTIEERMAGNLRDHSLALQSSEAALRNAEYWVAAQDKEPSVVTSCSSGCATAVFDLGSIDYTDTSLWSSSEVRTYSETIASVAESPRYFVEFHSFVPDSLAVGKQGDESGRNYYRITSRGTGSSDSARAYTRSTYTRRF